MRRHDRYLLDTNVVSETRKVQANSDVLDFLGNCDASSLYVSCLTLGELRKGVEIKRSTDPVMASRLGGWVDGIEQTFSDRILPIDISISRQWGELSAARPRPVIDTLIAATALAHGLTLVTRNTDDFRGIELATFNPWLES